MPTTEGTATIEHVTRLLGQASHPPAAPRRRKSGFQLTEVGAGLRLVAVLLGVFFSYAVLRIHELYPVLLLPRLPMLMAIVLAAVVVATTPLNGWRSIWLAVPPIRWQALLVVLGLVTAPLGIWMSGSLTYYVNAYAVSVVVFLATAVILRDRRAMAATLRLVLLVTALIAAYTLSDSAVRQGHSGRVRLGLSLDPNDLAMLLVSMFPLSLYMAQRKGGRSMAWSVVAALTVAAVVPTQSRGAILGLGAIAVTLIGFGTRGWKRVLYVAGVTAAALAVFIFATASGASRLGDFTDYSGGEGRIAIWKRGLVWMSWRPWGFGIDNFPVYFGWLNGPDRAAHNSFIQVGVELGVLGLLAFSMLFLHTGRDLIRQRRHALSLLPSVPDAAREARLATFVMAMMAGTATSGFFLSKAYAGVTLFAQALGIATLLGYPYRDMATPASPAPRPAGRNGSPPVGARGIGVRGTTPRRSRPG